MRRSYLLGAAFAALLSVSAIPAYAAVGIKDAASATQQVCTTTVSSDSSLAVCHSAIDTTGARVNPATSDLQATLNTAVATLNTAISTLNGKIDTLNTAISTLNGKVDTLNGNVAGSTPAGGAVIGGVLAVSTATGGAKPYHLITAATTNSTLILTGAHTLYTLSVTGVNGTIGWLRLYDSATAPTCSSGTGAVHSYMVLGSSTQEGGQTVPLPAQGEGYLNGLAYCFTGGGADTDNTSGPAGVALNATYQ